MKEKKPLKIKFKTAVILVVLAVVLLGVCGANVYATKHGYESIFFLIKYRITKEEEKITDRDKLLIEDDETKVVENQKSQQNDNLTKDDSLRSIEDVALEWRKIEKIKNYKDFIYDFDGDGIIDKVTLKSTQKTYNDITYNEHYVELNGKVVIENMDTSILSAIYIVDINKNDNKIEIIVEEDGGSDDPEFSIYAKNRDTLDVIARNIGFNLKTNQQGTVVAEDVLTMGIKPVIYRIQYYINNGVANKKDLNKEDIENITYKSEGLYFTQDMNNVTKYLEKSSNNTNYKLEDEKIYNGVFTFKILKLYEDNYNQIYVRLEDGREGYLFTADGNLAG